MSLKDWDNKFETINDKEQKREEKQKNRKNKKVCHSYEKVDGCIVGNTMKKMKKTPLWKCKWTCSKKDNCVGF